MGPEDDPSEKEALEEAALVVDMGTARCGRAGGEGERHGRAEDQMRWEANIWQSAYTYVVTKADEGPQGMP